MSDDGYRIACLNGVLVILVGLVIAGFPLTWIVTRDVYHQAVPISPVGDYRAWRMAHLEGLLNGLLVIALAAACRVKRMGPRFERVLIWSLLISAWGNLIASIAAPILQVRAMAFDSNGANNALVSIFTVALVTTFLAFGLAIGHLSRRERIAQL